MAASMLTGSLSPSLVTTATRVSSQKPSGRPVRPVCLAAKQDDKGYGSPNPIFSAAVVATVAGGLMFADVGAAQAGQGDIYQQLGIEAPSGGTSGIIVSTPEKQTPFQSGTRKPKPAPAPAPVAKPAPKAQVSKPAPKPKAAPKPVAKKPAPKPAVKAPEKKPKVKPAPIKKAAPLKISKEAVKSSTQGSTLKGLDVPTPSAGSGKVTLTQPGPKKPKQFSSSRKASAGITLPKFELPKFQAPSIQAPSISAPSIGVPTGADDKQQALAVAGIEVVLALLVSSLVGGLFTKKPSKA